MFNHLHSCRGMWHRLANFHVAVSEPVMESPSPHPSLLKHQGNLNFGLFWEFMLWTMLSIPLIIPFVPVKAEWSFLKIFILCVYKINTSEGFPKCLDGLDVQGDSGAISATVFSEILSKTISCYLFLLDPKRVWWFWPPLRFENEVLWGCWVCGYWNF